MDAQEYDRCLSALEQENAKLREQLGNGTAGIGYKADLYDEVWRAAKSIGFNNVTDALSEVGKLREQLVRANEVIYLSADKIAQLDASKQELTDQLLAERLGNAALKEQLVESDAKLCAALDSMEERDFKITRLEQRTEASEARIKEAEEQETVFKPLTGMGQIKVGDIVCFASPEGLHQETVKEVLNAGTSTEEIIYNSKKNYYFITSMALSGRSWHKNVTYAKPTPPADVQGN